MELYILIKCQKSFKFLQLLESQCGVVIKVNELIQGRAKFMFPSSHGNSLGSLELVSFDQFNLPHGLVAVPIK